MVCVYCRSDGQSTQRLGVLALVIRDCPSKADHRQDEEHDCQRKGSHRLRWHLVNRKLLNASQRIADQCDHHHPQDSQEGLDGGVREGAAEEGGAGIGRGQEVDPQEGQEEGCSK